MRNLERFTCKAWAEWKPRQEGSGHLSPLMPHMRSLGHPIELASAQGKCIAPQSTLAQSAEKKNIKDIRTLRLLICLHVGPPGYPRVVNNEASASENPSPT